MNDCKGLLGKLFGHKFERYMIKSFPNMSKHFKLEVEEKEELTDFINGICEKYEIRCKRCGCKADE